MNVNLYDIEDYRKKDDFAVQKNKPNSNPTCSELVEPISKAHKRTKGLPSEASAKVGATPKGMAG